MSGIRDGVRAEIPPPFSMKQGKDHHPPDLRELSVPFQLVGEYVEAKPHGSGHINDTYAVTYRIAGEPVRYIQQRINGRIFPNVPHLMENIHRVTRHLSTKLEGPSGDRRHNGSALHQGGTMRALRVIPCANGKPYYQDHKGHFWRTYDFVEHAQTYDRVTSAAQAYEAAYAFGEFQELLADLPAPRLHETIPGFHHTRKRFEAFQKAIDEDKLGRARSVSEEIKFFLSREAIVNVLLDEHARGAIPERVTHNDTKLNNVLLDDATGRGVCVIDLDTVMPGLALYDFGDLVRTSTSPALEDELDLSKVTMQMPMFEALVNGYLASAGKFLTDTEKQFLPFSGKLITYEIGLRFLTDYLEGDVYFKTKRKHHNLDRARTQMALVRSIEAQESALNAVVERASAAQPKGKVSRTAALVV